MQVFLKKISMWESFILYIRSLDLQTPWKVETTFFPLADPIYHNPSSRALILPSGLLHNWLRFENWFFFFFFGESIKLLCVMMATGYWFPFCILFLPNIRSSGRSAKSNIPPTASEWKFISTSEKKKSKLNWRDIRIYWSEGRKKKITNVSVHDVNLKLLNVSFHHF